MRKNTPYDTTENPGIKNDTVKLEINENAKASLDSLLPGKHIISGFLAK
ncbi:MAG: hypothetical protein U9Q98_00435 [Bacteroidota bacterium]|nr:hypothetical protein [Bacteroidota bacterium]